MTSTPISISHGMNTSGHNALLKNAQVSYCTNSAKNILQMNHTKKEQIPYQAKCRNVPTAELLAPHPHFVV